MPGTNRLAIRERPGGWPIMYQVWDKLLFLHWPVAVEQIRPLVPAPLEIDTYEGQAWIGVTPFTIRGVRPPLVPPLPVASRSHEINVRTYVHFDGVPGVWFLSLDASNPLAVWGARIGFFLPYFRAAMDLKTRAGTIRFRSRRTHAGGPRAEFQATWSLGDRIPQPAPESREFFLIERYCLYAERKGRIYRARIHHHPWPLSTARLTDLGSSMVQSHGLSGLAGDPLVHAQAEPLRVGIWPLRRVKR